jgi:hypothetical protein
MFEEIKDPIMCPYCGSIENDGITCRWCRNKITDDYESEEQPMNVELRFTGLTPKLALRLIEVVNESGEQPDIDIPSPARNIAPAAPAQMPAPAPVPMQSPAPYQMPAPPTAPAAFGAAPSAPAAFGAVPTAPAPVQNYQPAPTAAPTAPPPQYDVEMLGRAAAPLAAAGKRQELYNLLQSFGVQSINELPKERYGEMALALRGMGAQI